MNLCIIIGNLTADPVKASTTTGKQVTTFTVAVNDQYNKERTDFFRVSAWGKTGENCVQYLHKGSKVEVQGKVSVRAYTNKAGTAGASLDLVADSVEFLSAKRGDADDTQFNNAPAPAPVDAPDDLPF